MEISLDPLKEVEVWRLTIWGKFDFHTNFRLPAHIINNSVLIGPALSPILGGIFTEYTSQTWRSAQYFLAGCSALSVVLTFFFLPETIHPPTVHESLKKERGKKFVMYWVNPFRSVMLLRWPNIAMAVGPLFSPFQQNRS